MTSTLRGAHRLAGNADRPWRLEGIYFAYLAAGGVMFTYWPYHLTALGLSASAIGLLFGVRTAIGIVSQPIVTGAVDRLGAPGRALFVALGLGFVLTLGLPFATSFWVIAALIWCAMPGLSAVIPVLDASIVRTAGIVRYGRVRLWGSAGYGVSVGAFGLAFGSMSYAAAGRASLFVAIAALGVAAAIAAMLPPDYGLDGEGRSSRRAWRPGKAFFSFAAANGLHWSAVMAFNVFLSLHARESDFGSGVVGVAVAVAIAAEVVAFAFAGRVVTPDNAHGWLPTVCVASAFRWVVTALAPAWWVLVVVQVVHALSFGVWYAAAVARLGAFATIEDRAAAQGWLAATVFGIGGVLGSVGGGFVMDHAGGRGVFLAAAVVELSAVVIWAAQRGLTAARNAPGPGVSSR